MGRLPYSTALRRASASPMLICRVDLWGNEPLFWSFSPEISAVDVNTIPAKEAMTPMSFFRVNISTPIIAPIRSVQMPNQCVRTDQYHEIHHLLLVAVRMVELATLV